ncbi:hypothetical protein PU02_0198 [Bartonella ancashensis]|uniref:Uncharacterized protein n=1 Tax=Bartonella ancashensis TaxID=1318743 RepID=A0A0M4M2D1_9HYPH|nr:hypothetical protein PU02_0198 [Bartonella ancashensis]
MGVCSGTCLKLDMSEKLEVIHYEIYKETVSPHFNTNRSGFFGIFPASSSIIVDH